MSCLVPSVEHLLWSSVVSFLFFFELGFDGLEGAVHVSEQFKHFGVNWRDRLLVLVVIVAAVFCVFVSFGFFTVRRTMLSVSIHHFFVFIFVVLVLGLGTGLLGEVSRRKPGRSACRNQNREDQGAGKASDLGEARVETHKKLQRKGWEMAGNRDVFYGTAFRPRIVDGISCWIT